jgi:phosphoserine phosphatase
VAPVERIATFDNDGTLWVEQPLYTQLAFALDRIRALAPEHPEWREQQPFKAVLENDLEALKASGMKGVMQLVMASHTGMTTEEFETIVEDWLATAEHPKFARPYTELVYQPMLELLAYLRDNGFKTFIVSGGGVEFMRPWTEQVYGIPPEQVATDETATEIGGCCGSRPAGGRAGRAGPDLFALGGGEGHPADGISRRQRSAC